MLIRVKRKRFKFYLQSTNRKNLLFVKGPLGSLSLKLPKFLILNQRFFSNQQYINSIFSFLSNSVRSLIFGHFIQIKTEGVGFKFHRFLDNSSLLGLNLGHSHSIYWKMPDNLFFRCQKYNLLLFSVNKQLLNSIAFNIRQLRSPDAYKGKGLKFGDEILKFKPGKIRQR